MINQLDDDDDGDGGIFGNLKEIDDPKLESIFDPLTTAFGDDSIQQLQKVILAREQVISELYRQVSQSHDDGLLIHLKSKISHLETELLSNKQSADHASQFAMDMIEKMSKELTEFKEKVNKMEKTFKSNKIDGVSGRVVLDVGSPGARKLNIEDE